MSRQTLVSALGLVLCLSAGAYAQDHACPPSAPDGYHGKAANACTVTIDRSNPASPLPIVVKTGTKVTIKLTNARENEAVTFAPTTTQTPAVDVATTFIKSAITPLQSLVINDQKYIANRHIQTYVGGPEGQQVIDPIAKQLNDIIDSLDKVLGPMSDASVQLSCLQAYRVATGSAGQYDCTQDSLPKGTFQGKKEDTIKAMMSASRLPLPTEAASMHDLKKAIDDDVANSLKMSISNDANVAKRNAALKQDDLYLSTYTLLTTAITDVQKTQAAMLETAEQLTVTANSPVEVSFPITQAKDYSSSVAIVAQEVISKTNTTVATVVINWQSNPWEIATGIMFSTLENRTFSNAPLFANGQPQLDADGKNLTIVTESVTRPAIMLPVVTASYRIGPWSNAQWENQCPGHCAILLTGGVGLNLAAKTAEFLVGPSFQFGGLLLTPGWHIGRQSDLAEGLAPGKMFGSSPPDPLPTTTSWTMKFGLTISYVLPFQ